MRGIGRILGVAVLWVGSGAMAAWGLQRFWDVDGLLFSCGSLSLAVGMALLQITTLSEEGRAFFYEGRKPHEDYLNLGVVLLWSFPFILVFSGLLWWAASKLAA